MGEDVTIFALPKFSSLLKDKLWLATDKQLHRTKKSINNVLLVCSFYTAFDSNDRLSSN
jgi:hypothetical protein